MPDIFLSYASKDRERVKPLVEALTLQGLSVWWDRKIPVGKTFDQVIEEALDAAYCVVVVWSSNSVISEWVRNEADEGLQRHILVPVLIDDVKIPLAFRRIQAARLVDWGTGQEQVEFESLVETIKNILDENSAAKQVNETGHKNQPNILPEETRSKVIREDSKTARREIQTDQVLNSTESKITSGVQKNPEQVHDPIVRPKPEAPQSRAKGNSAKDPGHAAESLTIANKGDNSSKPLRNIQKFLQKFTDEYLFVGKAIPPDKLNNAINAYAPQVSPRDVLLLYDNTLGKADIGFLLTADTIYWHNDLPFAGSDSGQIRYTEIQKVEFRKGFLLVKRAKLLINEKEIDIAMGSLMNRDKLAKTLANLIRHLANL